MEGAGSDFRRQALHPELKSLEVVSQCRLFVAAVLSIFFDPRILILMILSIRLYLTRAGFGQIVPPTRGSLGRPRQEPLSLTISAGVWRGVRVRFRLWRSAVFRRSSASTEQLITVVHVSLGLMSLSGRRRRVRPLVGRGHQRPSAPEPAPSHAVQRSGFHFLVLIGAIPCPAARSDPGSARHSGLMLLIDYFPPRA